MKNIYKTKYIVFILSLCFCFASCNGQNKHSSEYNIGVIPSYSKFEKMTAHEVRLDSLKNQYNAEKLERMLDGTAFREGVSEAEKQEVIKYHKITTQKYEDNRSRYYMELNINDKKDTNHFRGIDTLTAECSCYLNEDTIHINMGFWAFGGFAFSIDLFKNEFESTYWEDTHKQLIYKAHLSDTSLVDNVRVENKEQSLVLENQPNFLIGEIILGHLIFKTNNYYRTSEYDSNIGKDDYSDEKMDKLNMAGALYFKCKVREKTLGDL